MVKQRPDLFTPKNCKKIADNLAININKICYLLIEEKSTCIEQNYTVSSEKTEKIIIHPKTPREDDHKVIFDEEITYDELYKILNDGKNYTMKLIDGALITFYYEFEKYNNEEINLNKWYLSKHRLAFFPSTQVLDFDQDETLYESDDDIYIDMISKNIFPTPLRIDYDYNAAKDRTHPISHLTIGQYKNCRIPVSSPIKPSQFMNFILKNFYNTLFDSFELESKLNKVKPPLSTLSDTITENEKQLSHFVIK